MKTKIVADSTCDLSPALIAQYNIEITPLYVMKDGVAYADGLEIQPEDIYEHVRMGGALCTTAAVNYDDYLTRYRTFLHTYDAIIQFTISSEMSSCYQNALLAAHDAGKVYVVDSRNLSTGIGQLVLDAAILAQRGMDAEEIFQIIEQRKQKLDVSFVLDTLEYLRKGGRCSAVAALGANLLQLKPCIEVRDGVMGVGKKYRGNLDKCLVQYVRDRLADPQSIDSRRIFITHSSAAPARVALVEQAIRSCMDFDEILETRAGCTISSHCGPNCLGILFYRK